MDQHLSMQIIAFSREGKDKIESGFIIWLATRDEDIKQNMEMPRMVQCVGQPLTFTTGPKPED